MRGFIISIGHVISIKALLFIHNMLKLCIYMLKTSQFKPSRGLSIDLISATHICIVCNVRKNAPVNDRPDNVVDPLHYPSGRPGLLPRPGLLG